MKETMEYWLCHFEMRKEEFLRSCKGSLEFDLKMVNSHEYQPRGSLFLFWSRKMILAPVIIPLGGINHRIEGLASFWQTSPGFWLDACTAYLYNHATCEGWKLECRVADLYSMNGVFLCQPPKILPALPFLVFLWLGQPLQMFQEADLVHSSTRSNYECHDWWTVKANAQPLNLDLFCFWIKRAVTQCQQF